MKSDIQLQHDVNAELQWEPAVHAARIGVQVQDGVVTLSGQVDNPTEKWHAERAAQRVMGVHGLSTALKVHLASPVQRTDADIARAAENLLSWNAVLPADAVKVMVENGWVTLSGEVEWHYQRQAASDTVRQLMGVTGVSDQIALKPSAQGWVVKADIEAALKRTAASDAREITVGVQGGDVTLTGQVHSWHERNAATHSAWGSPGVRNVIDRMTMVL
jgi:osmotically-inducible protein OsmY